MDQISKSNALQCCNPLQGEKIDAVSSIQIIGGVLPSGLILGLRGSILWNLPSCAEHSEWDVPYEAV